MLWKWIKRGKKSRNLGEGTGGDSGCVVMLAKKFELLE
jgi:hypothetical protein